VKPQDIEEKYPFELSGGQMQRVAIARALVTNPKIVFADEPTANLDSKTAYMIIELMKKIQNEHHTTFVFATHDEKIVANVDRLITIVDGEIVEEKRMMR
jgi:putative ABC transport system ATP-binding protein